jgi:hypothetical protein
MASGKRTHEKSLYFRFFEPSATPSRASIALMYRLRLSSWRPVTCSSKGKMRRIKSRLTSRTGLLSSTCCCSASAGRSGLRIAN